jgi:hypothetical protein
MGFSGKVENHVTDKLNEIIVKYSDIAQPVIARSNLSQKSVLHGMSTKAVYLRWWGRSEPL